MSGDEDTPTVSLIGSSMSALLLAIPVVREWTGRPVIVIGGLAVMCRMGRPYRATSDLDTVFRRSSHETPQLQLLMASGATESGPSGVLVPTSSGPVQVDVLEVNDAELTTLPTDPNDRLHVLSHAWAAATGADMTIQASAGSALTVAVARPGPLVAMKLQSVMNRSAAKESTDLLDILRLMLDPTAGPMALAELGGADAQLRADAAMHAKLWFADRASQSLRTIRRIPEGRETELDDIHLVGELLAEVFG